ncbi:MAG TPA: hypothetical protein VJR67_00085 [Candidatus Nitrosopolaris sp.]|nr:hypothetical protein [Candidatus Nitrosopolaris sp.]
MTELRIIKQKHKIVVSNGGSGRSIGALVLAVPEIRTIRMEVMVVLLMAVMVTGTGNGGKGDTAIGAGSDASGTSGN